MPSGARRLVETTERIREKYISMDHPKLLEKPIFAVTSLGTRVAVAVSRDSTVGNFKRKFEKAHLNCFPELGKIIVLGLQVRKKSCFYSLSDSFPLKHAFQDTEAWFLHIVVCHLQDQSGLAEYVASKIYDGSPDLYDKTYTGYVLIFVEAKKSSRRVKRKKWKMKKSSCFKTSFWEFPRAVYFLQRKQKKCSRARKYANAKCQINRLEQRHLLSKERAFPLVSRTDGNWGKREDLSSAIECRSETISGTVSVSGIINRYFSGYDEVTSNSTFSCMGLQKSNMEHMNAEMASDYQCIQHGTPLSLVAKTPAQVYFQSFSQPTSRTSRDTPKEGVGMRLVEASVNLGLSTSKQNAALSLSKFMDRSSGLTKSANTHIRSLIFEITDEDG